MTEPTPDTEHATPAAPADKGSNMLKHIEQLEKMKEKLESDLKLERSKNEKMSAKTREGMQSALDSLMKKWMDAVQTKDERVKDDFKQGLERLVKNSAEENGVWQMMVAASALHERQVHDLDKLQGENEELRKSIDGRFAAPESRKRPADEQLDRTSVAEEGTSSMWADFASEIGTMY
jgi:ribosome-binding ATPase YchF (GTP1/OBG family)